MLGGGEVAGGGTGVESVVEVGSGITGAACFFGARTTGSGLGFGFGLTAAQPLPTLNLSTAIVVSRAGFVSAVSVIPSV